MKFNEKLDKELFNLMFDIKDSQFLDVGEGEYFECNLFPKDMFVSDPESFQRAQSIVDRKRKLLQKLSHLGVIEIVKIDDLLNAYDSLYSIKISKSTEFEELYNELQTDSRRKGEDAVSKDFIVDEVKPEIEIGKLVSYSDGSICFDGARLEMRSQIKDLCRMFMQNKGRMLSIDDIRDGIINADKIDSTPFSTISKYVSELRSKLKEKYQKQVIYNQKNEGWIFDPERLDSF